MSTRILALTILSLLTSLGPLFSQTTLPEKIVFTSDMDGDFDIWMINPDGTELEVLIDRPGNQSSPRISPDGRKIAFLDAPDPPSGTRDIVVRDLATGSDTVLDTGFLGKPSAFEWNGDNSGIIARNEGPNCTGAPIAFVPLSGGGNIPLFVESGRRLTVMAVDELRDILYYTSDPCQSPNTEVKRYDFADGQRSLVQAADGRLEGGGDIHGDDFVFYKAASGFSNAKIHLMNVDGSGERVLSSGAGLTDANPRFSPDGRQVVFLRRESDNDIDIYTVDISTLVETPLVFDPFNSASPDWGHILLNSAPICDVISPVAVECAGAITAVDLDGSASSDPDGKPLTYSWTTDCPDGSFDDADVATPTLTVASALQGVCGPLDCSVTLTVSDDGGLTDTCSAIALSVTDTSAPTIALEGEAALTLECSVDTFTDPGASSVDACDPEVTVVVGGAAVDPTTIGSYLLTYDAADACGNDATQATRTVDVADTIPPSIERLLASRDELWPPNHRMVEVTVSAVATDACDGAPTCAIVAVASDEPIDGDGDGHTAPDWLIVDGSIVLLRAERAGDGDGRVYIVRVSCADAAGNATVGEVTVSVPLSRRR